MNELNYVLHESLMFITETHNYELVIVKTLIVYVQFNILLDKKYLCKY